MDVLGEKISPFAIDISDRSLKILGIEKKNNLFSKKEKFSLSFYFNQKIDPDIIEEGEITKKKILAGIIKELLEKHKIKKKFVNFSLPEEKSFLRVIQLPPMEGTENIKRSAFFEAENYIPLSLEEVYIDAEIIGKSPEGKIVVLIAATPKKIVDSYVEVLKMAGLFLKGAEIESISLSRALIKKEENKGAFFIVDFGGTRTSFIIHSQGSLRFTTTIPLSSTSLTESLSKKLKISFEKAEKIKREFGLLPLKKVVLKELTGDNVLERKITEKEALLPFLRDDLEKLVREIQRYIDYYLSHIYQYEFIPPDGKKIEKIILCGGGANLKGLNGYLSKELEVPVVLGNPWINIPSLSQNPPLSKEDSLSFATAIGLAERDII